MKSLDYQDLEAMRPDYERLFVTLIVNDRYVSEANNIVQQIILHEDRYREVEDVSEVPWFTVGIIHMLESSGRFDGHLHNGDSLELRTQHVPAGRPKDGDPPFTWQESAVDALHRPRPEVWDVAGTLHFLELYNGMGYRNHGINSPYLFGGSNHYIKGKYTSDGDFDANAVTKQLGGAVLLQGFVFLQGGVINVPATTGPYVRYSVQWEPFGLDLQRWLNTFPGNRLDPDGWPGRLTNAAFHRVTGNDLPEYPDDKSVD